MSEKRNQEKANDRSEPEEEKSSAGSGLSRYQSSLARYLSEVEAYKLLSPEEEKALARRYREEGDLKAAERLVTANLRFVVKIAMEHRRFLPALRFESEGGRGELVRLLDLIQEGNIGLMMAVKKFDPERGYRLISYAVWWIRAYIQKYLLANYSLVKLGTTQAQRKIFYKLAQVKRELESLPVPVSGGTGGGLLPREGGTGLPAVAARAPVDYGALAEALDVKEKELMETDLRMALRDFSLDAEMAKGEETTFLDALPDQSESQEEALGNREEKDILKQAVELARGDLDEREAYIIQERYFSDSSVTLQEIGDKYGISRERARQIEEKALAKIRKRLQDSGWAPPAAVSEDKPRRPVPDLTPGAEKSMIETDKGRK
ncbi:MAG: RNA polymerase factor sigma-32 [bacterium]|nr:RNA polymerase factor sigma-32 [bacterium]